MTITELPEGFEADVRIYIIGQIDDERIELCLSVSDAKKVGVLELDKIVKGFNLDELGSDWRLMTRDEIADFKSTNKQRD